MTVEPSQVGAGTDRVHLKVHQLAPGEGDDHLPLVDGTADDRLLPRGLPLVDTLVCSDMADTVRVHLERRKRGGGEKLEGVKRSRWREIKFAMGKWGDGQQCDNCRRRSL